MDLRVPSLVGYILMVAAIVALLVLQSLIANTLLTISLQLAGVALMVWARLTFGWRSFHLAADPTDGGLVTSGPYRWVRHPIYGSVLLLALAGVATHRSVESLVCVALLIAGVALRVYSEERLVTIQYPEYVNYAATTKRVVPFIL